MQMDAPRIQIYVDESIHDSLDFIVSAFVFSKEGLEGRVAEALSGAGLRPGIDEFKSGAFMTGNAVQQDLRDTLMCIAGQHTRVALAVSPATARPKLGEWCLKALATVVRRNGFHEVPFDAHFDEGILGAQASPARAALEACCDIAIGPNEDSKKCMGIQVADVVAHATGQMIREAVTGRRKMVGIGGPDTGYADDDRAPLGWSLKMSLRHSLLRRPLVQRGQSFHPETDPVIVDPGDDYVAVAQHPDVSGWGVQLHDALSTTVRMGVLQELGKIWLGCIH
jgi:hypothetical protein